MAQLAPTQPAPTLEKPISLRMSWIDYSKGIAIVLVVLYHVIPGMSNAHVVPDSFATIYGTKWAYAFHMPVFFFVSGLFAMRGLRKGYRQFIASRSATILYPYVVWTIVYWCFVMLMGRWTNNKPDSHQLLRILYQPYLSFWFLYSLALVLLAFAVMIRWGLNSTSIVVLSVPIYFLGHLMMLNHQYGFPAFWHGHTVWPAFSYFTDNFIYFATGLWLRDWVFGLAQPVEAGGARNVPALAVSTICFGVMSVLVYLNMAKDVAPPALVDSVAILVAALLGIAGLVAVCIPLGRWDGLPLLRYAGLVSMEIYVLHELCTSPTRIVLQKVLHYNGFIIHVILGTTAGLLIPMAVASYCRRHRIPYLFAWGKAGPTN